MKRARNLMTWRQAVWTAKRIAKQIGLPLFVVEHDGKAQHERFSIQLTQPRSHRLIVCANGNTL